jgi:hypothetical protein
MTVADVPRGLKRGKKQNQFIEVPGGQPMTVIQETDGAVAELIPSERAVLGLIRMLFLEANSRTHRVTALRARWPVLHVPAYEGGYLGLAEKGLISISPDAQAFQITNAGLNAMVRR